MALWRVMCIPISGDRTRLAYNRRGSNRILLNAKDVSCACTGRKVCYLRLSCHCWAASPECRSTRLTRREIMQISLLHVSHLAHSVCHVLDVPVSCVKTTQPIAMPLSGQTCVCPKNLESRSLTLNDISHRRHVPAHYNVPPDAYTAQYILNSTGPFSA